MDGPVDFSTRDREREIDELERDGDRPVFFGDFFGGVCGEVRAAEDAEGGDHVEVADGHHDGFWGRVGEVLGEPFGEVFAGDVVHELDIDAGGWRVDVSDWMEMRGREEQTYPRALRVKRPFKLRR